ncbi:hypothetical protein Dimus_028803 [Dionaea muscipula]
MQAVPRWKNLLGLRNSVTYSSTHFATFHSTPVFADKWTKNKSSSNQIKYATRRKRADQKKALNDLLFHSGASRSPFQHADRTRGSKRIDWWDEDFGDDYDIPTKNNQSKSSSHRAQRAQRSRMKRQLRKEKFVEDDDHGQTIFQARFGDRFYTWAFNSSFQSSTTGFDWRRASTHTSREYEEWECDSETESDDEASHAGCHSDRRTLGLPPNGPLKIEDVKNAYRLSALKWHPDKHQGPSQAAAEEKFKQCVDAYKSLCSVLTTA